MKRLLLVFACLSTAWASQIVLEVKNKTISVNGKESQVYTIEQPYGTWGYYAKSGDIFDVVVKNNLPESTVIHWHGLLLPNNQDGVELTQVPIAPNASYHYRFKLQQSGTYWMHSHFGLQEQKFAEAPLIIDDGRYPNQAVIMFQDFSFKQPEEIMRELKTGTMSGMNMPDGMDMSKVDMINRDSKDLNDVKYDAFLTNYRPPQNPQVFSFKPGSEVRLRFINGASATNFWINLGQLQGTLIAVDGEYIKPVKGSVFPLAMAQRMDIVIKLPTCHTVPRHTRVEHGIQYITNTKKQSVFHGLKGTYPILGQVEGLKDQTGVIISTNPKTSSYRAATRYPVLNNKETTSFSGECPKISPLTKTATKALNYNNELKLVSLTPLSTRKVDKIVNIDLGGNMQKYVWTINNQVWPNITPIKLKSGDRVELDIHNKTTMMHPIHLHGNIFEMVSIDGKQVHGALRDTLFITPGSTIKVIFDANEPGKWLLHCHMLYHMHSGMMTYINVK